MSRGQKILEGGVMESFTPSPSEPEGGDVDLNELVGKLIQEVDSLRAQVDDQDARTSKWLTSEELNGDSYDPSQILSNMKVGDRDEGTARQMYFGTDSHPIPEMLLRRYGPKFKIGQRVQVNPDADVWGAEGIKWGSTLQSVGCAGRGVVKKVIHLTDDGTWKYQVRVPGLTTKEGDGFREHELLPVKQKVTKYVVEE